MSSVLPEQGRSTTDASIAQPLKSQRVLACALCQQRKVKCDRKFPCVNCIKSQVQCVPATLATRRRRRTKLPDRELLDRLRKYEELLRQNNVEFEPLNKHSMVYDEPSGTHEQEIGRLDHIASPSPSVKPERAQEARNIWHAMNQGFREHDSDSDSSNDGVRQAIVKQAMDKQFRDNDHLLFGLRTTSIDLSSLHPGPAQLFRLWQIYLDNVNPLLKVMHTPSLQGQIIEAASNVTNISTTLEALMFSIYCVAILSLSQEECQAKFGSSKEDLSTRYQFGCQQALLNCGFLRSDDRDCLTALYLYLVSIRSSIDPRSLSSMLGVAIRIAHRLGIHNESANAKCTVFEAEMRRRLWWSLIIFDSRIGELAACNAVALTPTWDCELPLNINDTDLRPEMKESPDAQEKPSDAIFAVLRAELSEFVRHARFHLDFTSQALKHISKNDQHERSDSKSSELVDLENLIEAKYLRLCDPGNPVHFMTVWTTRGYLAKCRLVEHYSLYSSSTVQQTDLQRDVAVDYAIRILGCDTKIVTSPLTRSYHWLAQLHFPFPAYIHLTQDIVRRPLSKRVEQAWEAMSENYENRFDPSFKDESPLFGILAKIILHAWDACEVSYKPTEKAEVPPRIVSYVRHKVAQLAQNPEIANPTRPEGVVDMDIGDLAASMPLGTGSQYPMFSAGMVDGNIRTQTGLYPLVPGQGWLDADINQFDWGGMNLG